LVQPANGTGEFNQCRFDDSLEAGPAQDSAGAPVSGGAKKYDKNRNFEEFKCQLAQREQELRTNPLPGDVQSGAALNAFVYDLTDPDIASYQWGVKSVPLPSGTSVKELIFSFTPHSVSTQASAALSRGVIALSRLDIKDKWRSRFVTTSNHR
jgi:hypothetical protein